MGQQSLGEKRSDSSGIDRHSSSPSNQLSEPIVQPLGTLKGVANNIDLLCHMKSYTQLTPAQAEIWVHVLQLWPDDVLEQVCVDFGGGLDPFPDLGKLICQCRRVHDRNEHRAAPGAGYDVLDDRTRVVMTKILRQLKERGDDG